MSLGGLPVVAVVLAAGVTDQPGVATALRAAAPSYPLALAGFALIGIANAPFVTATFAARSEYAPPEARAQMFVSMASLKVAAAAWTPIRKVGASVLRLKFVD